MHMSVGDPGSYTTLVYLDGELVDNAIMADDILGIVMTYQTNEDGVSVASLPPVFKHGAVEFRPGTIETPFKVVD